MIDIKQGLLHVMGRVLLQGGIDISTDREDLQRRQAHLFNLFGGILVDLLSCFYDNLCPIKDIANRPETADIGGCCTLESLLCAEYLKDLKRSKARVASSLDFDTLELHCLKLLDHLFVNYRSGLIEYFAGLFIDDIIGQHTVYSLRRRQHLRHRAGRLEYVESPQQVGQREFFCLRDLDPNHIIGVSFDIDPRPWAWNNSRIVKHPT